ncbi:MAG: hypothetical protein FWE68_04505, partial [Defluviitaleaceae bacterium]|nr:hypothetical protein [Defluviitaleaceae bacterium]
MRKARVFVKKATAAMLCAIIICVNITYVTATEPVLTRGQAYELLLVQGLKYNAELSKNDIIKGAGDGNLRETEPVRRGEFYVMLSRAFELPEPTGGIALRMPEPVSFGDAPAWAQAYIDDIVRARILPEASPLDETITMSEARLLVQRIHTLIGTSLVDDFQVAANREYMKNAVIQPGFPLETPFMYVMRKVDGQIRELMDEILAGGHGVPGQKMAAAYNNYLNFEARNAAGVAPIQKYLDAIMNAGTLDELSAATFMISEVSGTNLAAAFAINADFEDSNKKTVLFASFQPQLPKNLYADASIEAFYVSYMETILKLAGFDGDHAVKAARNTYDLEKELAAYLLEPHEMINPSMLHNIYTLEEVKAIFPNYDLDRLLAVNMIQTPPRVWVPFEAVTKAAGRLYTEANLELLKD